MLVGNQSCIVPQRTLENKNNALNYECARPDSIKSMDIKRLSRVLDYLGGRASAPSKCERISGAIETSSILV
jgi:hypothetical protein